VISWNVAGLRAFVKKATDDLKLLYETEKFDVLAIQEHKLQESHVDDLQKTLEEDVFGGAGFHYHWNCSTEKKGYSGVAVVSKTKPLSVEYGIDGLPAAEAEGRVITAEFEDYFLVNVYVPNSGQGLVRLDYRVGEWDAKFSKYVKGLEAKKPVVLTGDMVRISCCLLLSTAVYCCLLLSTGRRALVLRAPRVSHSRVARSLVRSFVLQNCAAEAIDIHSPKTNLKSAGFTPEERASFASCYLENGLVDSFRAMYPSAVGFTYWGYRGGLRAKNKGWRLDYFLLSRELFDSKAFDTYHLTGYNGSDHCPLGLTLKSLKSLKSLQ
jgi:exodeoxyribonuclease-3